MNKLIQFKFFWYAYECPKNKEYRCYIYKELPEELFNDFIDQQEYIENSIMDEYNINCKIFYPKKVQETKINKYSTQMELQCDLITEEQINLFLDDYECG